MKKLLLAATISASLFSTVSSAAMQDEVDFFNNISGNRGTADSITGGSGTFDLDGDGTAETSGEIQGVMSSNGNGFATMYTNDGEIILFESYNGGTAQYTGTIDMVTEAELTSALASTASAADIQAVDDKVDAHITAQATKDADQDSAITAVDDKVDTHIAAQATKDADQDSAITAVDNKVDSHIAAQATKDAAQDAAITAVDDKVDTHIAAQATKDSDQDAAITTVDNKVDTHIAAQSTIDSNQDAALAQEIANRQSANQAMDNRMTAAEEELYSTTARSVSNSKRLDKVESRVSALESEVKSVKRSLATMAAISGLVEPRYVGDTTVSVGVAHSGGYEAVALGLTHSMSDNISAKVAAATDTQLKEVTATASVGFSF